jgi:hypothetical protein
MEYERLKAMTKRKFDDIRRIYDLDLLDNSYFPTKEIEKGFWKWKKRVPVLDRSNLTHARVSLTNRILQETGKILGRELRLAGIEKDKIAEVIAQLPQKLKDINYQGIEGEQIMEGNAFQTITRPKFYRGDLEFVIVNGSNHSIGDINYSIGIRRAAYYGTYLDSAGGVELRIFGKAIKTPEQFNALQKLH